MNQSWGHYAKWNNPDRESQITYELTYMRNLKINTKSQYPKQTKKKQAHVSREQTGHRQR